MGDHYIKRCAYCGVTISQCRCPGPKREERGVCVECYNRQAKGKKLMPIALPVDPASMWADNEVWPDPTPEMLASPEFERVWQCIKSWDINVPEVHKGYCGATGNHVRAILDALGRPSDAEAARIGAIEALGKLIKIYESLISTWKSLKDSYTAHGHRAEADLNIETYKAARSQAVVLRAAYIERSNEPEAKAR